MKKTSLLIFILAILFNISNLASQEKYSHVRIIQPNDFTFKALAESGLHIDHAESKPGYLDVWLSTDEMKMLVKSNVNYKILINDWKNYYDNLPKMSNAEIQLALKNSYEMSGVSHSIYGSMGGFLKYSEVNAKLDSMRLQYPNLISAKFSIGTTHQGRQIYTVRVTKNPDAPTGRPEVWYHSLIHSREPESMEHMIYYIYWLLENYNIDPLATYILNKRELYFTPVLNPDGYVYNDSLSPNGGGMWRKNRRNNGSSFGVDLNRNYGTYQYWNSSNNGSSTSASSDTYRGPLPFSEPETQAAMNFINSRNIQAVLGSHTYGNLLIKPWAWQDPIPTPDDFKFNEYLADMTKINNYTTGTPFQTVGYKVRGGADDWYYNDSVHSPHRIMAMTPETGTTGFWPSQAEIIPLAENMLFTNQYMAMIGGAYVYPVSLNLNKTSYIAGETGTLKIKFKNKGVASAQNVKIECVSQSYYLNAPVTFYNYSNLNSFQSDSSSFGFTISPAVPVNSALPVLIKFKQNDSDVVYQETKYIVTGNGSVTLADSAENTFSKWTSNAGWGITSAQSHTPSNSFTDSPSGIYGDNANNSMTLSAALNVSLSPVTYLSFWHRYATEAGYDYCNVEVSSNNGTAWQTVKSYNGVMTAWTQQIFDITSYAKSSSQLKIRFRLQTDANTTADGWYVDDIKIYNYTPLLNSVVTNLNLKIIPEGFFDFENVIDRLNMRDTVSVFLKSLTAPYNTIDSSKGVIDSLTYIAGLEFYNAPAGNYFIQVKHRNSIETWSKSGGFVYTFGSTMIYDFTSSISQAYGSNLQPVSKKFCIFSGDVNQNGAVNLDDLLQTYNDANNFQTGYTASDVTGDNVTELSDVLIVYNNSSEFVMKITPP